MTNESLQKIQDILGEIAQNIGYTPFYKNYSFWMSLGSIIVLSLTLRWLIKYTRATEKILNNQIMPTVDVNMLYNKEFDKTYFWFLNTSKIPAMVSMILKTQDEEHKIESLRIEPYHEQIKNLKRTAIKFDFLKGQNAKEANVSLTTTVKPATDNQEIESSFTKNYRFDPNTKEWNETTWNFPDIPFPQ